MNYHALPASPPSSFSHSDATSPTTKRLNASFTPSLSDAGTAFRQTANSFEAPLEEVVDAILQAPGGTSEVVQDSTEDEAPAAHQPDESMDTLAVHDHPVWESVFEEAQEHYHGSGIAFQDYREALKLYEQAARLGATKAYQCIGKMYRLGQGCTQSNRKAFENLKEGGRLGDVNCYAEMAEWFAEDGKLDAAKKCWDRYFASPPHDTVGFCGFRYYAICKMYNWDVSHVRELCEHFAQILLSAENSCSIARRDHDTPAQDRVLRADRKRDQGAFWTTMTVIGYRNSARADGWHDLLTTRLIGRRRGLPHAA